MGDRWSSNATLPNSKTSESQDLFITQLNSANNATLNLCTLQLLYLALRSIKFVKNNSCYYYNYIIENTRCPYYKDQHFIAVTKIIDVHPKIRKA